jgi:hypothetical protein|tara:strand:+ start:11405 stop:12490 length:1086 start_codon:yes stop_codon:yes gene_type:complete
MLLPQFALSKTIKEPALAVDIGGISELNGSAQIVRDKPYDANLEFAIQSNDEAITTNGRMAITFLDDSVVKLTEHSQLLIDEYIYDPDPSKSKMALTFGLGTARFITGNLNRIDKQNIKLKTPTANIAIRGTDFTATVDELGRSLIILLPDAYGLSSGEIEVVTALGSVILNKPFEATTVNVFENAPSKPVILDLTLDIIDNMLIVTPPKKEINLTEEVSQNAKENILDFNDLDIDYLDEDFFAEDELEFTELDINYLDTNYLEDLLNVLDSLAVGDEEDALAESAGVNITGTKLGQDPDTQITTLVAGDVISVRRSVNDSVRLDLNGNDAYTLIIIQDGVSNVVKINGGGDSVITITQSE